MTWKRISKDKNPYHNPEAYPINEFCPDYNHRLEVGEGSFNTQLDSIVIPGKIYNLISNYAYCYACSDYDPRLAVAFDEEKQKWIDRDLWYEKREWESLQESLSSKGQKEN